MREGLRERKKARTHQGIVDTAVEVFRERGYEKTTVEEIVRRVEISQPTFYKYFGSKDAVLREVAGGMLREWAQEAEAAARKVNGARLIVVGGAGRSRTAAGNALSALRAEAVARELEAGGLPVKIDAHGPQAKLIRAGGDDPEMNRRVEIMIER